VQRANAARRETTRDDLAELGVVRRILVDQHHPLQLDLLSLHLGGEADDRAVHRGGEVLVVLGDLEHVLVLGDGPVAVGAVHAGPGLRWLSHPVDGCGEPRRRELFVRDTGLVDVRVGEVEARGDGRGAQE